MGVGRRGRGDGFHTMRNVRTGYVHLRFEMEVFKFAVFPILGIFGGFVGHIVHDSSPPIKFRGDAPAKHQLAKPEPIGPMLNGNLCAT